MTCEKKLEVIENFKKIAGYLSSSAEEYNHYYMKSEAIGCSTDIVVRITVLDSNNNKVTEEFNFEDEYYANVITDIENDEFVIEIKKDGEVIKEIRFTDADVVLGFGMFGNEIEDLQFEYL